MNAKRLEVATLGGGCFWCLEGVFEQVLGVESVAPGYCGGHVDAPTYHAVCTGSTGHAEVVRVVFEPQIISYESLLEIFFAIHDPTTLNRQGNDIGTQYRSIIFCHSDAQKDAAQLLIQQLEAEKLWASPVQTEICPEAPFFAAEKEHRQYHSRNPDQGYCRVVIAPKVAKLRSKFKSFVRTDVASS